MELARDPPGRSPVVLADIPRLPPPHYPFTGTGMGSACWW
jgi:hypothetical protein